MEALKKYGRGNFLDRTQAANELLGKGESDASALLAGYEDDIADMFRTCAQDVAKRCGVDETEIAVGLRYLHDRTMDRFRKLSRQIEVEVSKAKTRPLGHEVLNRERCVKAAVRSNAANAQVEILRAEVDKLTIRRERAVVLAHKQIYFRCLEDGSHISGGPHILAQRQNGLDAPSVDTAEWSQDAADTKSGRGHSAWVDKSTMKCCWVLWVTRSKISHNENRERKVLAQVTRDYQAKLSEYEERIQQVQRTMKQVEGIKLQRYQMVLARCRFALAAKAYDGWKDNHKHLCRAKKMIVSSGGLGPVLAIVYVRVSMHVVTTRRQQRHRVRMVLSRISNSLLASAWGTWAEEAHHHKVIASNALNRFLRRDVVAAWNTWTQVAYDRKRIRYMAARALQRWRNNTLWKVLANWSSTSKEIKTTRAQFEEAESASNMVKQAHSFGRWLAYIDHMRELNAVAQKNAAKLIKVRLRRKCTFWRFYAFKKTEKGHKLNIAVLALGHRHKKKAMNRWKMLAAWMKERDRMVREMQKISAKYLRITAFKAWLKWLDGWRVEKNNLEVRLDREKFAKARRFHVRIMMTFAIGLLRAWKRRTFQSAETAGAGDGYGVTGCVQRKKWVLSQCKAYIKRAQKKVRGKCFLWWASVMRRAVGRRHKCLILSRWRGRAMRMTAFHSWEDLVSSQKVEDLDQRAVYAEKMALLRQRYVTANIVPLLTQLAKSADVQLTAEAQEEVAQMTTTLQNTRFGKNTLDEDQMPTEKRLHIERRALLLAKDELKRLQEEVLKVRVHYNGMVREKDTQLATMKQQYEARWKVDYQALRHANAT
eukprot:gene4458-5470_t